MLFQGKNAQSQQKPQWNRIEGSGNTGGSKWQFPVKVMQFAHRQKWDCHQSPFNKALQWAVSMCIQICIEPGVFTYNSKKSPDQEIGLRRFSEYQISEGSEWYQIDPRWLRGHSCSI